MNNKVFELCPAPLTVVVTDPAAPNGGDPCRFGNMTGVAVDDERADGLTVVDFGLGVYDLPVTDTGAGIAVGDLLYYVDATNDVRDDATGFFFGFALEAVGAGLTATIQVLHVPSPAAGALGAGAIATAHLAAGCLSADAAGRAKMAAGYFAAATVTDKFAVNSITGRELATGVIEVDLAAGTAAGADVALAAMAVGDEILAVLSFTTAAAIARVDDRTAEYVAGAGVLTKAAGTAEVGNQLLIIWVDKT
jgi:predicted RecA/RadA family phage recombinase